MGISEFEFKVGGLLVEKIAKYRNSIPRKAVVELTEKIIQAYKELHEAESDPVDHFREVRKMMEEDKIAQMTNANWIRALTDEELAEKFQEYDCPPDGLDIPCSEDCTACWLRWLQQPVDAIVLEDLCAKSGVELQPYKKIVADVVEVVRCKDCKHFGTDNCALDTYLWDVIEDGFCSYGEKRDNDDQD